MIKDNPWMLDKWAIKTTNKLFPKKYIKVYGGDDSALHAALKWSYINGYLEGTLATHLHSNGKLAKAYRDIISA